MPGLVPQIWLLMLLLPPERSFPSAVSKRVYLCFPREIPELLLPSLVVTHLFPACTLGVSIAPLYGVISLLDGPEVIRLQLQFPNVVFKELHLDAPSADIVL